ncbi:MAG TPA: single-stranded-DNA-specific exonuclease RecJ [Rhizomicrobium sp.]|jgi:single-stranded-DNA-specific exonuclease|nr:single-stranded-DNA-specific exonuclease RecJ [Rhizomicrobium sp.]
MHDLNTPPALSVTRSFSGRRWLFRETDKDAARLLAQEAEISPALAGLLHARNVKPHEVADYLNPTLRRLLPEPFLLKDMENAVARTVAAIEAGETIAVLGDYDVDGSCAAALLHDFLAEIARPPLLYIPDRMREGYGPNAAALLQLKEKGAALVVTVDCGATAHAVFESAIETGLDIIVLDHHAAEHPAPVFAQVNPNQPGDHSGLHHLCATAVTFLFSVALNRALRGRGWYGRRGVAEPDLRALLDLVGLATVCDVVPLVGINRAFVRAGETRLSRLERPGIRALAQVAKAEPPFSLYHCGFVLGPRINAGGRVGGSRLGVELLIARSEQEAHPLAEALDRHNRERQAIESLIVREALDGAARQDNAPFLLLSGSGWHPGVVGIVAGRLKDRFHKPAFVVGFEGQIGRGSARSVPGIDVGLLVRAAREEGLISAGGGHAMAAGFALEADKLDGFHDWLTARFAGAINEAPIGKDLWLDGLLAPSGATPALAGEIDRAGPYGAGNAEPVFATSDVRLAYADVVGRGHVRLKLLGGDGAALSGIAFRAAETELGTSLLRARGERIHAAGFLRARQWNGKSEVQLEIADAAPAA